MPGAPGADGVTDGNGDRVSGDGFLDEALGDGDRRPKKRLRERWLLLGVVGLLTVLLAGGLLVAGWYAKSGMDALNSVERDPSMMPTTNRPEPVPTAVGRAKPPLHLVIMGTDARSASERGRSDVLMVLHLTGDRKAGYLVSFPRDYWVDIPGRGKAKINAAYSWGGPALTVATLEKLLGVPMDHTALIDFEGFIEVIDALGGVTVVNKEASSVGEFDFPKGEITLTGESALVYVRQRKGLSDGDFGRAERQREVTRAVIGKLMSRAVLTNPVMFRDAVTTLGPYFRVDEGLDNATLLGIATSMRIGGPDDIRSLQAPAAGFGTSADKQSYVVVDEAGLAQLAEAMRTDTMADYYAANHG